VLKQDPERRENLFSQSLESEKMKADRLKKSFDDLLRRTGEIAGRSRPVARLGPGLMARVISIANQKGGVGKTTTAINLAASLAHLGQETLLIDMDAQANLTSGLGLQSGGIDQTHPACAVGRAPLEEILKESGVEWLDVAPSHMDLYGAELDLVNMEDRETRLLIGAQKVP
jgi:Mrp family chromosome partitioning ATPase